MTSRRAFLAGLPAAAALASLPIAAVATDNVSVTVTETPAERVDRLMFELAQALDDHLGGKYRAIVEPYTHGSVAALQLMRGSDANLQRVDEPGQLIAGRAVMQVGRRRVTVNTDALPQQFAVVDEDSRTEEMPGGVVEYVSMPERGAEYVVVTADGRIVVTRLEQSLGSVRKREPRVGWMPSEWQGYRASAAVTVLGKVLSEAQA